MNVLGKGPDRLKLPQGLQKHVSVHRRLPFQAFYWVICHTLVRKIQLTKPSNLPYQVFYVFWVLQALIPSLASPKYFISKFSSTIITSLSTGTPIIATQELLTAYSFLSEESVFFQVSAGFNFNACYVIMIFCRLCAEHGQGKTELEMDVMLKVSKMPLSKLLIVREHLRLIRESLNERSLKLLESFLSRSCNNSSKHL